MPDVFISYKREDRELAGMLAGVLKNLGYDVWYDFELLTGDPFRGVIRRIIDQCAVVIVMWSQLSASSEFVLDEASHAKSRGKLLPVRIDGVDLPFGFGQTHTDDLTGWAGSTDHPGFQRLLKAIQARAAPSGASKSIKSDDELAAFNTAILAGDNASIRKFLARYPDGALNAVARGELRQRKTWSSRWGRVPFVIKAAVVVAGLSAAAFGLNAVVGLSVDRQIGRGLAPDPLSSAQLDALVRKSIEHVVQGDCSETLMMAPLLAACRLHVSNMQATMAPLGAIETVKNEGRQLSASGVGYATRFLVKFERGQMRWEANGTSDGRLAGFWSTGKTDER